jgi:hypothetical protein
MEEERDMKRILMTALVLSLFVGCGGSSTSSTPDFEGVFVLFQIRNVSTTEGTTIITPPTARGRLNFSANGTFSGFFVFAVLGINRTDSGTFTVNGSTLKLTYSDGSVENWQISGDRNRITTVEVEPGETTTFIFVRE